MSVDDVMTEELLGEKRQIRWQQRDPRKVEEVARGKIEEYFAEDLSDYTPSVFVQYLIEPEKLRIWDRVIGRSPIFEDWIFQGGRRGEITISAFGRKKEESQVKLGEYLANSQRVLLTFMFGTRYNNNCIIDCYEEISRIGVIVKEEKELP